MTGYGEGREENEKVEVYLQIKTLNHRFLELEIRHSQFFLFAWEKTIKDYIKRKIKRGKVVIDIEIKRKQGCHAEHIPFEDGYGTIYAML